MYQINIAWGEKLTKHKTWKQTKKIHHFHNSYKFEESLIDLTDIILAGNMT